MKTARKFTISGEVQRVGYRFFAQRAAARHQITGYVRNLPDGRVEAIVEGPLDSVVPEKSVPEVLAVLREALSNVARHAGAGSAFVTLTADTRAWRLTLVVEDDGVGPSADDEAGTGTATMAGRARRLGGECRLEGREEGGARLLWWASLDEPR